MKFKKIISLILTLIILIVIFLNIDISKLKSIFIKINPLYFILSQILLIPIVLAYAYRFKLIVELKSKITLVSCLKMNLVTYAFNIILPSRLGELGKSIFLKKQNNIKIDFGINLVIFEKIIDVLTLCCITIIGIMFIDNWTSLILSVLVIIGTVLIIIMTYFFIDLENIVFFRKLIHKYIKNETVKNIIFGKKILLQIYRKRKYQFFWVVFVSFSSWILILAQTYLFFLSLNININPVYIISLIPIALIIGQLPITIAGIGTRDSALIILFKELALPELMMGVGILITLRYIFLAFIGSFFVKDHV